MGESVYQDFPWRKTSNLFHALTAEIFLQRTKAKQVLPVYRNFTRTYEDPSDVINDGKKEYETILEPLGLKWRIPLFYNLCKDLTEEYGGKVPVDREILLSLPGIGDYVVSAFLSFHFNEPLPLVDANTVRFVGRFFKLETGPESRRDRKFKGVIEELLSKRYSRRFNYAFLDFSMNICSTAPKCGECKLRRKCKFFN